MLLRRYISNPYLRTLLYLAIFLAGIYIVLNWLLANRTKSIIENVVSSQTHGKVLVDIGQVKLKIFPLTRLDLLNTQLKLFDSTGKHSTYQVKFTYLGMQLHSLNDLIFRKKLQVDFLVAENPNIQISPEFKELKAKSNTQVHFEIGNIYKALQKIAMQMQIKRFGILNGKITLLNLGPNKTTISLGGVNFTAKDIAMLTMDTSGTSKGIDAGRIRLNTKKQEVVFPEGNITIRYGSLRLDTEDKLITIDSFQIEGKSKQNNFGQINASFSSFKLYNLDFWSLDNKNIIKIDSLVCTDPVVKLKMDVTPIPGQQKLKDLSLREKIAGSIGRFDLGYLGLINSSIQVETRNGNKYSKFETTGNTFEMMDINIDSSRANPLAFSKLAFAIRNYSAPTPDSMYRYYFDSVIYADNILYLKNFKLKPSAFNKKKDHKSITIPDFELHGVSMSELISSKKLKADELVIKNFTGVNYYYPDPKNIRRKPTPFRQILKEISNKVDIDILRIENGSLLSQSLENRNDKLLLTGFDADLDADEMFDASTYELMGYSIDRVAFDSLEMRKGATHIIMLNGEILGEKRKLTARQINVKDYHTGTDIRASGSIIHNYHFDDNFQSIVIDSLLYKSANINIHQSINTSSSPSLKYPQKQREFLLKYFRGSNTTFELSGAEGTKINTHINYIMLGDAAIDSKNNFSISKLEAQGDAIRFLKPGMVASTGEFRIVESNASYVDHIEVAYQQDSDTIKASVPKLAFTPMIAASLQKKYPVVDNISLLKPVIDVSLIKKVKSEDTSTQNKQTSLSINSIVIRNGSAAFRQHDVSQSIKTFFPDVNLSINNIRKNIVTSTTSIGITSFKTNSFELTRNDSIRFSMKNGKFELELNNVLLGEGVETGKFNTKVNRILARGLDLSMISKKGNSPITLKQVEFGGENIDIDSLEKTHIINRLKTNESVYAGNINYIKKDDKSDVEVFGVTVRNGGRLITIDSFHFLPVISRDSFNSTLKYQKDYVQAYSGKIKIHDLDLEQLSSNAGYTIRHLEIDQASISLYKDKRIPFEYGIMKPLPVDMLKRIETPFHIDSVTLQDASVFYEEFSDKTNTIGKINFTKVKARVRNIKNFGPTTTDSLYVLAYARFLDTTNIRIHFDESYLDSLSGFYFTVRVGKVDLTALNKPLLMPIASAKVISGVLDTLQLRSIGRKYIAHGKMKMQYRDLKVEFLNKNDQDHKTVVTKFVSWVANGLVRTTNTKNGMVFAERNEERGIVNYWIKIILGGTLTNAGIRSNTKSEKKYKKSLKKINVPEIPDVQL